MTRARVIRRVRARHLDHPGEESAALWSTDAGWRLTGIVRVDHPEGAMVLRYRVDCDDAWRTRSTHLGLRLNGMRRSLWIATDLHRRWEVGGMARKDLRGCVDVDMTATAATNIIPIQRLRLPVGAGAESLVAWITFPDLDVHPIRQIYTRIAEDRYRYEAPHNGFVAEFDVDELGLVRTYPGYWERI